MAAAAKSAIQIKVPTGAPLAVSVQWSTETIGGLRERVAEQLGVSASEVTLCSSGGAVLEGDSRLLKDVVSEGAVLSVGRSAVLPTVVVSQAAGEVAHAHKARPAPLVSELLKARVSSGPEAQPASPLSYGQPPAYNAAPAAPFLYAYNFPPPPQSDVSPPSTPVLPMSPRSPSSLMPDGTAASPAQSPRGRSSSQWGGSALPGGDASSDDTALPSRRASATPAADPSSGDLRAELRKIGVSVPDDVSGAGLASCVVGVLRQHNLQGALQEAFAQTRK
jgi:hypothetical protein